MSTFRASAVLVCLSSLTLMVPTAASARGWHEEVMLTESFDVGAGGRLEIDVHDADVVLETGGSSVQVEVVATGKKAEDLREEFDRQQFQVERSGDTVRLSSEPKRGVRFHWGNDVSLVAHIRIPERFEVAIKTGDGDVSAQRIVGDVSVRTGDGDVEMESIEGGRVLLHTGDGDLLLGELDVDELTINTGDGDVTARVVRTKTASMHSGDGDISLRSFAGRLEASTGDGDLDVRFAEFEGLDARTGDGDLLIEASADISADLILRGEDVAFRGSGVAFEGERRDHLVEGSLNGGGPALKARTGDGSVVLRLDE